MAEYIDKNKAINAVFEAFADGRSAYIALEAIPSADVAPVRHGRWVEVEVDKDDDGIPTLIMAGCDQCHSVSWTSSPFCGYCGAKMDGGKE